MPGSICCSFELVFHILPAFLKLPLRGPQTARIGILGCLDLEYDQLSILSSSNEIKSISTVVFDFAYNGQSLLARLPFCNEILSGHFHRIVICIMGPKTEAPVVVADEEGVAL